MTAAALAESLGVGREPRWRGRPIGVLLAGGERIAAIAAIGLLIVAAVKPDESDRDLAPAARAPYSALNPGIETTFGAYLGAPYHHPSDVFVKKPGVHDFVIKNVEWYTLPFENPLYYGARVQRWFAGGRAGTMIDFTHSKAYAPLKKDTKFEGTIGGKPIPETGQIKDFFQRLEFTHGHNMLTLNGLLRVFGFSNRVAPYAGIGAGISLPHAELHLTGDPARTYEYQYTGPNAQALAGIELRLKTGSIFFEYKFTIADYTSHITHRDGSILPIDLWNEFSEWWSGQAPPGGTLSTRLTSHQVIGGFLVRFVPEGGAAVR